MSRSAIAGCQTLASQNPPGVLSPSPASQVKIATGVVAAHHFSGSIIPN